MKDALTMLAFDAVSCLLAQIPVTVTHPAGWERDGFPLPLKRGEKAVDGFPLPLKRGEKAVDGSVTQNYRPLAILEYVHEKLSGKPA